MHPHSPCPRGFGTHVGVGGLLRHENAADLTELLVHLQESVMLWNSTYWALKKSSSCSFHLAQQPEGYNKSLQQTKAKVKTCDDADQETGF